MEFDKKVNTLLEKNAITRNLLPNSEEERKKRAKGVNFLSFKKFTPFSSSKNKPLLKGWKRFEFVVSSEERTQNRNHSGYLVLDNNNNVKDVYCSCADFQYLWRYPIVKDDLASWETYPEYTDIEDDSPHTRKPTYITNPNFERKLCKHLIAVFEKVKI